MNYLEERCLQGEACVPGRHVQNDYAELLSMNHRADSWIGNYLRHSPLKFFFAVRDAPSPSNKAQQA